MQIDEQRCSSLYNDLSFDERIGHLVNKEYSMRHNKKINRFISSAKLKLSASIEDIDFSTKRSFTKATILEYSQNKWLENRQNLIITGPTGVGKTFIACALGNAICRNGISVKYERTSNLMSDLMSARLDGSYAKLHKAILKSRLLILDEWLRDRLNPIQAREFLDIIDDRYRISSTIFVSQIPVDKWHSCIEDPTIADAILDRVVHNSTRLDLKGDSMRKILLANSS